MRGTRYGEEQKWELSGGRVWPPGQRFMAGRPPSPFFSSLPSTIFLFISITAPWRQIGELLATWVGRPATYLGRPATCWLPYRSVAKGSLFLHP
jgi:hypothetical protein